MRDLQKIADECISEMKVINIPIRDDKIVEIKSELLDENYGLCEYDGSYNFDIVIDERLLQDECPLKELKEVVIHELIHTCPRCLSHSNTWRKYARIMNDVYGYSLLDCKDDDSIFHSEMPILHRFRCPKCGSIYNSRMSEEWKQQCEFCYSWMEKYKTKRLHFCNSLVLIIMIHSFCRNMGEHKCHYVCSIQLFPNIPPCRQFF